MKRIRTTLQTILIFALVGVIILTIVVTESQSKSGYSLTTQCSPTAREWIIENFGDAENIEELLNDINAFIGTRTYIERKPTDFFQYYDIDKFIKNDANDLCFGWSCFVSSVCREIAIIKGWDITPLVVDAVSINDSSNSHSYNFVVDERNNKTYYLDTTHDNTRKREGRQIVGIVDIGDYSMEEFSEDFCGYEILNYH